MSRVPVRESAQEDISNPESVHAYIDSPTQKQSFVNLKKHKGIMKSHFSHNITNRV